MIPARWYPDHTSSQWRTPAPGSLVAINYAVWRVIEVRTRPRDLWDEDDGEMVATRGEKCAPQAVIVRPAQLKADDPRARVRDRHLRTWPGVHKWHVYRDEHYPVCAQCGEPTPCRERVGARVAEREMTAMARYETPGMCPACNAPISARQKSMTFQDNIKIPAGPPVTYHVGRRQCRYEAAQYEKEWAAGDPTRRTTLSCLGEVTTHGDGTYECTAAAECRGPVAFHDSYVTCGCKGCHAHGRFGCHPAESSIRRGSDAGLFGGAT